MAVDWEQRIDFDRLRTERLARAKAKLEESDLGALLLFDPNNIRYVTSTHIGEWARDKNARWTLLPRGEDPILWDFGSAATPSPALCAVAAAGELPRRRRADARRDAGRDRRARPAGRSSSPSSCASAASLGEPVGVDMADMVTLEALKRAGIHVTDGSRVMLEARKIKSADEVALLDHACGIVDAVYEEIYRLLRPGVHEHEVVARAQQLLFELGSDHVEAINAVSGDRCNPHPHVFSDRLLRPGDQAFFDVIHSFMGYRTCYYRTFNVGGDLAVPARRLQAVPRVARRGDRPRASRRDDRRDRARSGRPPQELGFPDEEAASGLQFGHGVGVGLYEPPMISRVHSFHCPIEIEEGMVFALETYCAATDGRSAARIEEEVVVTKDGNQVLTRFPAEELLVAGKAYVRGADILDAERSPSNA